MNQQLMSYISEQLQAGLSYQDIEAALLGVGWDAAEVKQALASTASSQTGAQGGNTPGVEAEAKSSAAQPQAAEPMPATTVEPAANTPTVAASPASPATAVPVQEPADNGLASVVGEAAVNRPSPAAPVVDTFAQTDTEPASTPGINNSAATTPTAAPVATPGPSVESTPARSQPVEPAPVAAAKPSQTTTPIAPSENLSPQAAHPSAVDPGQPTATAPAQPIAAPVATPVQNQPTAAPSLIGSPVPTQNTTSNPYPQPAAAPGATPVQAPTYPYPLNQPQQPYQAPAMTPGYPGDTGGYSQPANTKTGLLIGLFGKKIVIAMIAGAAVLILIVIVTLVLTGGKKGAGSSNNSQTTSTSSSGLTEAQAFTSDRGGFSINPPKDWKPQELTSANDVVVAITKDTADKSKISSMTITVSTLEDSQAATVNLDSFVNLYKTNTTQTNPLVKINDDQKVDLNGLQARVLDIDSVNDSTKVTGYMTYAIKDKKLYQIQALTFDVTPNNETKRAMRESIQTFKLNDSAAATSPSTSPAATTKP